MDTALATVVPAWWSKMKSGQTPPPGHVYPHSTVHPLSSVIFAPSFTLALKTTRASGRNISIYKLQ